MYSPDIWKRGVPINFGPLKDYSITMSEIQEAVDEQWIELMWDFDNNLWWRRHLNETRELGL